MMAGETAPMSEQKPPCKNGDEKRTREIGMAVSKAREYGLPYKILMVLTGLGRTRLHQLRQLQKKARTS